MVGLRDKFKITIIDPILCGIMMCHSLIPTNKELKRMDPIFYEMEFKANYDTVSNSFFVANVL